LLVADDHEMVRRGLRGVLEAGGYEVIAEASDGSEAVEKTLSLAFLRELRRDLETR
jgi:DNA-binding NarL/FixJ family response regulator